MGAIRKRKKIDVTAEKQILIALITNTQFIAGFKQIYKAELMQMPFARLVAGWCFDHYEKYECAPQHDIQDIFEERAPQLEESQFQAIEAMLLDLSDQWDEHTNKNYKRLLDKAEKYMQSRNLQALLTTAQEQLDNDDVAEAEQLLKSFKQIRKKESQGYDLFRDKEKVAALVTQNTDDVLFHFKGAAGRIIPPLCRGEFLAFAGPEKRGKSFHISDVGKQALIRKFKVAHFNFEMPDPQIASRYVKSLTGAPGTPDDAAELIPVFDCINNQVGGCRLSARQNINSIPLVKTHAASLPSFESAPISYTPCTYCKNNSKLTIRRQYQPTVWYKRNPRPILTHESVVEKLNKLEKYFGQGSLKFLTWPSDTKSIDDVQIQLHRWEEEENWVADVIITDYADLMIPSKRVENYRHGIDDIWKGHKRLAQEQHAAVVSGTQTISATYTRRIQQDDLSEDKRKASHVDRILALNQTEKERQQNLIRWSTLFERHRRRTTSDIVILQHLPTGNAFLDCYIDTPDLEEDSSREKKKRFKS